ncbi:MAG: ferredoxin-type protein NapG [Rhodanobacteraceae bacterium]|nr:ferredoxin-type protein NapG [Rhodanobacteraceae bacterium]
MNSAVKKASVSRRKFLVDSARSAAGVAAGGVALVALVEQSKSLPANALRPPGALAESAFQAACVRCGLCVRACPYDTLKLAEIGTGAAAGTPYFIARKIPCEMCDDIPCVPACPTGALDRSLTDIDKAKMGIAVLVSRETCLNFLGLRCDVCYRDCPLLDKAITLQERHNQRTGRHAIMEPTVHADYCTGCGKCEKSCVLEEAAIKVLPVALATGKLHDHYRLGWEEKKKQGEALVPGIIELPKRMPEVRP